MMLTKKDVIQLYRDGLEIRLRRKSNPDRLKGYYDPAHFEISIFLSDLASESEFRLTLLHEFIHARDERKGNGDRIDEEVEAEARATDNRRPHVLEFIKELYYIGELKDYRKLLGSGRKKTRN